MTDEIEREIVANLKAACVSSERALAANDMTAYKLLAIEEARLTDALKAIWSNRER